MNRVCSYTIALLLLAACGGAEQGSQSTAAAGEGIYQRYCFACHGTGGGGAPRLGDTDAWAPRIAKGSDALLASTIAGIPPGMPPRGMCLQCSDDDLAAAVAYMVGANGGN